jgi:hypothetical protein
MRTFLDKNTLHRSPDIYNCSLYRNSVIVDVIGSAFINKFILYNIKYITVRKNEIRDIENIKIENKNLLLKMKFTDNFTDYF